MFFTAINQMMTEGVDLMLVIRKANGQLTVSTLPKSNTLKDEAQNHIVPLTVTGLPEELDAGFLQVIARPIQRASGLITNMAQFEAQAEKAASDSKASKEAKAKETKEEKEKEKREKYEKYLKKAEEQIAAQNHKDAVATLGQARFYAKPQDQKRIDEMIAEQKKAMSSGSLFDLMEDSAPQPQVQQQAAPQPAQSQQIPQYPPQPQMQRPMGAQPQNGQQNPQQQMMWPPQQPLQRPMQRQAPPQPQYGAQPQMPPQQPQQAYGEQYGHWQEEDCHQDGAYSPYGQEVPAYRPEDYEEYLDFPKSMLEPRNSHYAQTV